MKCVVAAGLSAAALMTVATTAVADAFPSKPIPFVVPHPPGGASDATARLIGQKLTGVWGQQVVVDNRPGADGNIAADMVAKAPADGHTILMGNVGPNAISRSLYRSLPYDPIKSFAPVSQTTAVPIVLVVNPSLPVKDFNELLVYAKANPHRLKFASAGNGSSNHLTGEMPKDMAHIDIVHVPYKGDSPALTDLMGGQVGMMFTTVVAAMPHIKSGKVRALATAKRSPSLPNVPIAESGIPGFDSSSWGGVLAPAGTPKDVVEKLHSGIVRILALPDTKEKLNGLGAEMVGSSPEELADYIKSETAKWEQVVKQSGATAD